MLKKGINDFGKELVQNVRDYAIRNCDIRLHSNNLKSPVTKRWLDAKRNGNLDEFGKMLIPDCVDEAIFYLLQAIDEGILDISLNMPNGDIINLKTEGYGELAGWYVGQWISEYSNERFIDDFPNIG